jgi:hypothetical protein
MNRDLLDVFRVKARACTALFVLAGLATFPTIQGCGDDESQETTCRPNEAGPTVVAPACSADPSSSEWKLAAETFRADVVNASSLAGMARRQVDAVTSWLFTCLGDIAVQIVVGALGGTPSGQICGEWKGSSSYAFRDGEYRFHLSTVVTHHGSTIVHDESSSTMRLSFTKPIAGFAEGAIVPYDLGRADTYLVGVHLVTVDGKAAIAYDRPGPLVELLGLGPSPENPLVLTEDAAHKMQETMRTSLAAEGSMRVSMNSCAGRSVIALELDRTPVDSDFRPRLVDATTTREGAATPSVIARTWDVVYRANGNGVPSGTIEADLPSSAIASTARVRFAGQDPLQAELELACGNR